jgi:hypothetical protein
MPLTPVHHAFAPRSTPQIKAVRRVLGRYRQLATGRARPAPAVRGRPAARRSVP